MRRRQNDARTDRMQTVYWKSKSYRSGQVKIMNNLWVPKDKHLRRGTVRTVLTSTITFTPSWRCFFREDMYFAYSWGRNAQLGFLRPSWWCQSTVQLPPGLGGCFSPSMQHLAQLPICTCQVLCIHPPICKGDIALVQGGSWLTLAQAGAVAQSHPHLSPPGSPRSHLEVVHS